MRVTHQAPELTHYGWLVSPYSAKTRAYLRFKGTPFEDVPPSVPRLFWTIRRAVGAPVMPTVRLKKSGEWLQDTTEIIDRLEAQARGPAITPPGAAQRVADRLLELHGDEWLPMAALHFRWNRPGNVRFALDEFGKYGLPWLPRPLAVRLVKPMAEKMRSYLPKLGITGELERGVERYSARLIEHLNTHFEQHDFLLGGRPCLGDFALFGPLWAHLYRDEASTELFAAAPALVRWFERLLTPAPSAGEFLADDRVPETLDPIFRDLFGEQFPFVERLIQAIDAYCEEHPDAHRVPRALGDAPFAIGGVQGTRKLITYSQWMAQRPIDAYAAVSPTDRPRVDAWLQRVGGLEALQRTQIRHRLCRKAFKMVRDRA